MVLWMWHFYTVCRTPQLSGSVVLEKDTRYHMLRLPHKLKQTRITLAFHTECYHLGEQFSFTVVSKLLIIH